MGSGFPDRRAGHSSGNSAPPASRLSLLVIRPARPTLVEVPLADPSFAMVSFCTVRKVGATRFEQQLILSGKPGNVIPGGAECGALPADSAPSTPDAGPAGGADPLLALVIEAWPTLTAEDRLAVVERIATKLCASDAAPRRRADESASRSEETNFRRRGTRSAPLSP